MIAFRRFSPLWLLAILVVASSQPSQGADVLGQVHDSVTGQPLANVSVIVYETGDSTSTDADGNYFFPGIPDGLYTFLVGSPNYRPSIMPYVQVGAGCCIGPLRGNVDYDPADAVDISDLVYLVDYMFASGPTPPCPEEVDLNADGGTDISDLVYLVDYMFSGGPGPQPCL